MGADPKDEEDSSEEEDDPLNNNTNNLLPPQHLVRGTQKSKFTLTSADPDDIHRQEIEDLAAQGQGQANINAQEIERLKQLAMGK